MVFLMGAWQCEIIVYRPLPATETSQTGLLLRRQTLTFPTKSDSTRLSPFSGADSRTVLDRHRAKFDSAETSFAFLPFRRKFQNADDL